MGISKRNYEGYYDPTPYEALKNIDKDTKNHNYSRLNQRNNQNTVRKKPFNQRNQRNNQNMALNQSKNQNAPSKVVYVCSPLRGDMERNLEKACEYCRFVITKGYIPLAVHLLFTRFMNDENTVERKAAISMGITLLAKCDEVWRFGAKTSEGMEAELAAARKLGLHIRTFNDKCEEVFVV